MLRESKIFLKGLDYFFPISRVCGTILCWVLRSKGGGFLRLIVGPLCVLTQCRSVESHVAMLFGEVKQKGELCVCLISACFSRSLCVFWYQNWYLQVPHAKSVWLLCNKVGYRTIHSFFPSLFPFTGSDEQCWDKTWCLLPGSELLYRL